MPAELHNGNLEGKVVLEGLDVADIRPSAEPVDSEDSHDHEITPVSQLPPAPNGGLHAWLKVLGGFLIYSNIWGFTLGFGTFQLYYEEHLLTSSSESAISWIGTVQAWLLILVGVLAGPLFDLGYFRPMLFIGNFLVVFGIMMLSLCKTYWQVFLAQGICMGLGAGLLYIPSLALIGIWFSTKRSLAMGIVTSGIAVGGVVYIIVFDRLSVSSGFPWAVRTMGFIALALSLAATPALLSGSQQLTQPRRARKLVDKSAPKDLLFLLFTASSSTCFLGYITPYFYIPTYAQSIGDSQSDALYVLVIAIAASFFGRLCSGYLANYLGANLTWMLCALISSILSLSWIAIKTIHSFIAFSVLWGFFSAGLVTLPGACFPNLCPDLSLLGTRLGMSWGVSSIATLIGAPIAGALLSTSKSATGKIETNFLGVQLWSGICLFVGAGWLGVLWLFTMKRQNKGWFI